MKQVFIKILKRASRSLLIYAECITVLAAIAVAWSLLAEPQPTPAPAITPRHALAAQPNGWGASALSVLDNHLAAMCPIAAANACGMGASSCYKCHEGGRGPAVSNSPWHTDHAPVNNDCAGCHGGSPWILRKSIAHTGMTVNPLTDPQKACSSCHQRNNISKLIARYKRYMKTKASAPPTK